MIREKESDKDNLIKKYIKKARISLYDRNNLVDKENIDIIICPICYFVLKQPISCSDKINSHSFCKTCIDKFLQLVNIELVFCTFNVLNSLKSNLDKS